VCVNQCSFETHYYDPEDDMVRSREGKCVGCHRCVVFCPTNALTVRGNPLDYRENYNWRPEVIEDIIKQAETGGVLLTGMGNDKGYRVYWDHLVLNASQVTNPSIDPLREPMELTTYLGRKPNKVEIDPKTLSLKTELAPQVKIEVPVMFAAMSYGAVSLNVHQSLARAATEAGTLWNTGEGGLHTSLYKYGANTIAQVASGRFGVHQEYLNAARVVEIKIGQGAKPGIGGHLPGEKVSAEVSMTRMIPRGTDALSPAPQHDIYSIEDLAQLVHALKEATNYTKPISVKIAAVHNSAAIASGMVRAGADIIVLDGLRGSTGAAPKVIRDNVGIPIEMALASVDSRLRQEGIRNHASVVISGGIRNSGDVAKAIALGADAVYIGTAALVALGCCLCQQCHTGKCAWGICTTDLALTKRVNPEIGARRLANLLRGWSLELKDILGGMGVNALESLRGNRLHLRGVGLSDTELEILGVRMAGS
jgi:glutamate synthase domain-containing protein 2